MEDDNEDQEIEKRAEEWGKLQLKVVPLQFRARIEGYIAGGSSQNVRH